MKLNQLSERIWFSDYDDEKDHPTLGYLKGDHSSLAVDAGFSKKHVQEFYQALEKHNLPLPDYTVITHFHWDHAFGIGAVHGKSYTEARSDAHLKDYLEHPEKLDALYRNDSYVHYEFQNQPLAIQRSTDVFQESIDFDLGNLTVKCFHISSPHTDDCVVVLEPSEKVLFLGDCISGPYPTFERTPEQTDLIYKALDEIDFEISVGGHWDVLSKKDLLKNISAGGML